MSPSKNVEILTSNGFVPKNANHELYFDPQFMLHATPQRALQIIMNFELYAGHHVYAQNEEPYLLPGLSAASSATHPHYKVQTAVEFDWHSKASSLLLAVVLLQAVGKQLVWAAARVMAVEVRAKRVWRESLLAVTCLRIIVSTKMNLYAMMQSKGLVIISK